MNSFEVIDLGLLDYKTAYKKQLEFLQARMDDEIPDTLVLVEHPPILTIGRQGSYDNILVNREILKQKNIEVLEVERGGDITYHGPGQLIIYPILKLPKTKRNVKQLIREIELAILNTCREFGANAVTIEGLTGVWIANNDGETKHLDQWNREKKISSIGLAFKKWCSYHGISININGDLSPYKYINLCGLVGKEAISLSEATSKEITVNEFKAPLLEELQKQLLR